MHKVNREAIMRFNTVTKAEFKALVTILNTQYGPIALEPECNSGDCGCHTWEDLVPVQPVGEQHTQHRSTRGEKVIKMLFTHLFCSRSGQEGIQGGKGRGASFTAEPLNLTVHQCHVSEGAHKRDSRDAGHVKQLEHVRWVLFSKPHRCDIGAEKVAEPQCVRPRVYVVVQGLKQQR
ncbi:hypothetical protein Q8A73_019444 [Channa argus]|nr:hypothetical protein Q8A73_019444 [Channa argus]